jgi:hypothetical protein
MSKELDELKQAGREIAPRLNRYYDGYVIPRVTKNFDDPKPGLEAIHQAFANLNSRLVAAHANGEDPKEIRKVVKDVVDNVAQFGAKGSDDARAATSTWSQIKFAPIKAYGNSKRISEFSDSMLDEARRLLATDSRLAEMRGQPARAGSNSEPPVNEASEGQLGGFSRPATPPPAKGSTAATQGRGRED